VVAADVPALEDAAEAACRAALRAGLCDADASDLAQEALIRALTSAQPPGGVPLAAWVYGIARNLGRDRAKSARSRELLVEVVPDAGHANDPAVILAVRRAVHELPEPLRDVVTLHELEELSLRETAEALAIPFDTAKDRLRRAREQLRSQLGDADYTAERTHTRRRAAQTGAAIVVAVLAGLGDRVAAAATATASVATRGLVVRAWLAAAIGAALAVGGFAIGRLTAPREQAIVEVAAASPEVATLPDVATAPLPPPPAAAVPAPTRVAPTATPAPAPVDPGHATERLLLERARAALQRGLNDEALVSLMSHERQFPTGSLAEERDVLIIEAYVAETNDDLARRRIARYRTDHPDGALRSRVDAAAARLP
jgi:RNA polymerase sigma-70 factor, ECF subfamily